MRLFTIVCLLFVAVSAVNAQSTNVKRVFQTNFKKAEEQYQLLAYRNALELYLATVGKDSSNLVARQRIADCYFRLGRLPEAERWYSSLAVQPNASPEYKYQYAQVLTSRGRYNEAKKWFEEYAKESNDARATEKIDFIHLLYYYFRDSLLYDVKNEPYNSDQSDFAPQYFGDGIVFVSARDRDMFIKHQSTSALNDKETMLNIYFAPKSAVEEKDAVFFNDRDLRSSFHDGPIAFFDNGKKVAFSRNNLVNGKPVVHAGRVNLRLYFGQLNANKEIEKIEPFPFNDDAFSIAHPWVSNDGSIMYFASNQPGGQGGVDIYISEKKGNQWQTPVNVGASINTKGDEFYPYLANDTTLYFSSTGRGGLGGLDIYMSKKRNGSWSAPENLGYPLNSSSDDFSLIIDPDGRHGMFSSDRPGGLGYDDIYSFSVKSFSIVGRTVDKLQPSKAVPGAKVYIKDNSGEWSDDVVSDDEGYFYLDVPFDKEFRFSGEKTGYVWMDTLDFSTYSRVLGRDSVVLKLWPQALFAKGTIYSNESQSKLPDATMIIKDVTGGTIDTVKTDGGAYSFEVQPNKKYVISAFREGFIPSQFELNTRGILEGSLVNDMILEEEFKEKVVLQFEFEKWDLKPMYHASLDKIVAFMARNKKYHLHIGAHADARGTHEYNLDLSNKRAKEVVKYLEAHGVSSSRMTAIGFGEELMVNKCSNGVVCHEDDHAKNRRAELKVQ
jgi:outer membrane protein OmpA-like peptidoglycan-associated protein/tetratricopeptide (TPR) repeat protein